jgi:hypothetical protein
VKTFFSCIDASIPAPQPVQHLVIRDRANKVGGAILFYGAEDVLGLGRQPFIRLKLTRLKEKGLDGVIFYTVHQFRYGGDFDYGLVRFIHGLGLEVHFACEGIAIRNEEELRTIFPFLMAVDFTSRRDESPEWRQLLLNADLDAIPTG